jgi:hypothetical protein
MDEDSAILLTRHLTHVRALRARRVRQPCCDLAREGECRSNHFRDLPSFATKLIIFGRSDQEPFTPERLKHVQVRCFASLLCQSPQQWFAPTNHVASDEVIKIAR